MRKFLAIALMLVSFGSYAASQTFDVSDLTAEQIAKIQLDIAQKQSAAKQVEKNNAVEQVDRWVDVGAKLGKGFASTAQELGVAANDFAKTGVGMFTMFLIGWHFVGEAIVGFIVGSGLMFFGTLIWIYLYRRQFIIDRITTYEKGKGPNGESKVIKFLEPSSAVQGEKFMYFIAIIVLYAISLIVIF